MRKPATDAVFNFIVVPLLFLTVALAGGVRFAAGSYDLQFIAPQLATVILGAFAMILFVRGGLVNLDDLVGSHYGLLENASGVVRLAVLYFATVQVFNAVTPEVGLLNLCFNLFYFLLFLNNLFVVFNPARLAKSLAAVLGASFALKYLVLADLFAASESWAKYAAQKLLSVASLGLLDYQTFAPATGYLAFGVVAAYVLGLYMIAPRVGQTEELLYRIFIERHRLTPAARRRLLTAVADTAADDKEVVIEAEIVSSDGRKKSL